MARTDKDPLDDAALDTFFEAARKDAITPSDALIAAILDDASVQRPQAAVATPADMRRKAKHRIGWRVRLSDLMASLGGWPALSSMAMAIVAGIWIGFASPTKLELLSGGLVLKGDYVTDEEGYALEDLAPAYLVADLLVEDEG